MGVLASIQERYLSLFRETPNQKDIKSKVPTTDFLVTARQKDNLSNNTIIKNIQEYIWHFISSRPFIYDQS